MLLLYTQKATEMPEWSVWPSRRTVPVKVPVRESVGDLWQAKKKRVKRREERIVMKSKELNG